MKTNKVDRVHDGQSYSYQFTCPHCDGFIMVPHDGVNCRIFRHGVFKNTGELINPHSSKEACESYIKDELIYGCGKPFEFIYGNPMIVQPCDYI